MRDSKKEVELDGKMETDREDRREKQGKRGMR